MAQKTVSPEDTYHVDVIKPDIVILDRHIAIEIDNTAPRPGHPNRHNEDAGASDDKLRDTLLENVGWRTLRIRREEQPHTDTWPWRITSNSTNAKTPARAIIEAINTTQPDSE